MLNNIKRAHDTSLCRIVLDASKIMHTPLLLKNRKQTITLIVSIADNIKPVKYHDMKECHYNEMLAKTPVG